MEQHVKHVPVLLPSHRFDVGHNSAFRGHNDLAQKEIWILAGIIVCLLSIIVILTVVQGSAFMLPFETVILLLLLHGYLDGEKLTERSQ